jgi:hypothetical protein
MTCLADRYDEEYMFDKDTQYRKGESPGEQPLLINVDQRCQQLRW